MQRYPYTISAAVSANTYLSLCRLSEEIGEPVSVIVRKMIETGIAEKSEREAARDEQPRTPAPQKGDVQ
jgi:predicted DNA-binding protein